MDELNITNQHHLMEIGRLVQMGQAAGRREMTGVKSVLQQIAQKKAKEM